MKELIKMGVINADGTTNHQAMNELYKTDKNHYLEVVKMYNKLHNFTIKIK